MQPKRFIPNRNRSGVKIKIKKDNPKDAVIISTFLFFLPWPLQIYVCFIKLSPKRQSPCSFYTHTINFANELFWAQASGCETPELFAVRKLEHHVLLQQDDEFRHFNLPLTTP
jgi:hypothetical protein